MTPACSRRRSIAPGPCSTTCARSSGRSRSHRSPLGARLGRDGDPQRAPGHRPASQSRRRRRGTAGRRSRACGSSGPRWSRPPRTGSAPRSASCSRRCSSRSPLLALERVAEAAEARRRPLRVTAVIAVVYLAHLQGLGGVSNIERTDDTTEWAMLGIYLVIGALIQALGALAVNEAARAIEDGDAAPLRSAQPLRRVGAGPGRARPPVVPALTLGRAQPRLDLVPERVEGVRGRPRAGRCRVRRRGASTCSKRRRNLLRRRAEARLGVDVEVAGDVDHGEQQVAELVGGGLGVAAVRRRAPARRPPRRSSAGRRARRASRSRPWPPSSAPCGRRRAPAATPGMPSKIDVVRPASRRA